MFILPEFYLRILVESTSEFDYGDIESIRLKLTPVPIDYKTSVVNARLKVMYEYRLYPTKFGGVESREATERGIVWLTDEEIDLLNDCKVDCEKFLNKFIEYTMGFKPFKDKTEDNNNNESQNQEET